MNPVPGYPVGPPPTNPAFAYSPLPPVSPQPVEGPGCTALPGFNLLPCNDDHDD